jgi:DNA replication protein DnaC
MFCNAVTALPAVVSVSVAKAVSSRYERASLIVTSNKPFGRWGEVFGDEIVAVAMIDRLVHHAEVIALKGDSYRLKDRDFGRATPTTDE